MYSNAMPQVRIDKIIAYWTTNSDRKWETAQYLMQGRRYSDALFFCHLTLESMLKAVFVAHTREPAPYWHDLVAIAERCGLRLTSGVRKDFEEITEFNIKGRYPDEKLKFYQRVTRPYAKKYMARASRHRLWLLKLLLTQKH